MRHLAVAAALAAGCARGPERIHFSSVSVAEGVEEQLRETGVGPGAAAAAARDALLAAGFREGEGGRPHRALLVLSSLRLLPPAAGDHRPRAEIAAEIALAPAAAGAGPPLRESGSAAVAVPGGGAAAEAWLGALRQATQRCAEALALAVAAGEKPERALIDDLASKDLRVREQAIRALGERRTRAAVPALVERLKDEEPRLAHRIVGALAQIGDERAVPALIDVSRGGDAVVAARLARHIGDIGGPEAEGYLLTLASGHPDPRVRKAAREALDDMSARAHEASLAARK